MTSFTKSQETLLYVLAVFGFLIPNGVFLYTTFFQPEVLRAAMANPVTLVYILEAFVLVAFFAWYFPKIGLKSPGWTVFVLMSLVGSLTFSVPAYLYWANRIAKKST